MAVDSEVDSGDNMEEREGDKVVTGEEEETPPEASSVKVEEVGTAPYDWRFPTTNQYSRHCYSRYLEYHKRIQVKGEGAVECEKFAKYYSLSVSW